VAARSRSRSAGSDSGGGFAEREGTSGHCSSFYEGPAAAGDPVARPRRPRARRRRAPWAGRRRRGGRGPPSRAEGGQSDRSAAGKAVVSGPVGFGRAGGAPGLGGSAGGGLGHRAARSGGSVWRLGVAAALRAGGGSVPVPGVVPPSAVLGAARRSAVRGPRFSGADSRAGFAARARTSGHCSSFYEGPAAAGDPVARPRRPRARRRPAPWAGCARRGPRRRGAVGVGPRGRVADSKADRRPEKLFGAAGGWRLGAGPRLGAARSRSWSRLRRSLGRRLGPVLGAGPRCRSSGRIRGRDLRRARGRRCSAALFTKARRLRATR
jgi:hypothetical protein